MLKAAPNSSELTTPNKLVMRTREILVTKEAEKHRDQDHLPLAYQTGRTEDASSRESLLTT